jgi:hypothetical protein
VRERAGEHILIKSEEDLLLAGSTLGIRVPSEALDGPVEFEIESADPTPSIIATGVISRGQDSNYILKNTKSSELLTIGLKGDTLLIKLLR